MKLPSGNIQSLVIQYQYGPDLEHDPVTLAAELDRYLSFWEQRMEASHINVVHCSDHTDPRLPNNLEDIYGSIDALDTLYVFTGGTASVWSDDLNVRLRAVHDLHHYLSDADFTLEGEIRAYQFAVQNQPISETLRAALFSEIVLQAAAVIHSNGTFPAQRLVHTDSIYREAITGSRDSVFDALQGNEEFLADSYLIDFSNYQPNYSAARH
jgi:hypothetical protein